MQHLVINNLITLITSNYIIVVKICSYIDKYKYYFIIFIIIS
jgi:hypothetical protein